MALEIYAYKRYASVLRYRGDEKIVHIPKYYQNVPVLEIHKAAFANSKTVEAVILPDTMETIGDRAFWKCRNLQYIGCDQPGLENTDCRTVPSLLPANLGMIGSAAFMGTALTAVEFLTDYAMVAKSAFERCSQLKSVSFPNCSGLILAKGVFMNSALEQFSAPKATNVTVPQYAFAGCDQLTAVEMEISEAGTKCFYKCRNLLKLNISKRLRHVGYKAFWGCTQLQLLDQAIKEEPVPPLEEKPEEDTVDCFSEWLLMSAKDAGANASQNAEDDETGEDNMEEVGRGVPLLVMDTPLYFDVPSRLKGIWQKESDVYVFEVEKPDSLYRIRLKVLEKEDSIVIRPLLDYFRKHDLEVTISGRQDKDRFLVYDMAPSRGETAIPTKVFQIAVARFRKVVPGNETLPTERPSYQITGDAACEAFIEMCGSLIPEWVHNAYKKNKSLLQFGSNVSVDEKRHCRKTIESLVNIDWNPPQYTNVPTIAEARKFLDECFFGREEQKHILLEIIAQSRLTGKFPQYGLLLVGPPGTGKTSAAKKIANLLSENIILVDVSTIGMNAEEVTGSSRIYANSHAGFLLDGMYRNRSCSGVLVINELDKARESASGYSVVNTLLSVLDKNGYQDNSLEELIPTQNMFAIATANDLSCISQPILDRFCIIQMNAYSKEQKKHILTQYALPRTMADCGIPEDSIQIDKAAVELLIDEYSIEPGAREIERFAGRIVRNYCFCSTDTTQKIYYGIDDIPALFGRSKRIVRQIAIHPGQVNVAMCENGDVYFFLLEAAILPGNGKFKVIGPLDKQQQDCCENAYWAVRNTISTDVCDLSSCDVVISVSHPIKGYKNHVGAATYAAICSRILNENYNLKKSCFIGGCDLNGSLFWDDNDLSAVLRAMKENRMEILYAPLGTGRLMNFADCSDCSNGIAVVEAVNAEMLVRLAINAIDT